MTTPKRTKQNTASSTTVLEAAVRNITARGFKLNVYI